MHKDLEGTVCSITTLNAREKDSQGPWKIAVAYRTNSEKTFATKLLEFEVTMDFLNGRLQKLPQLCVVYFFCFLHLMKYFPFLAESSYADSIDVKCDGKGENERGNPLLFLTGISPLL